MQLEVNVESTKMSPEAEEFREWLKGVTYKPGSLFYIKPYSNSYMIHIQLPITHDSTTGREFRRNNRRESDYIFADPLRSYELSNEPQYLVSADYIPSGMLEDKRRWPEIVRRVCLMSEIHEMDEWIKVNGKTVNNPHSPGYRR